MQPGEKDPRDSEVTEQLVWTPRHQLTDRQIDQFLVVSRSVGTFARALDCSSSVKQPSLHMSAAAASRDITLVRIMFKLYIVSLYRIHLNGFGYIWIFISNVIFLFVCTHIE